MANIQDIRKSIHAPQKSYMWEVEFQGAVGSNPDLTLFAKTVAIPQSAVEQMVINHKGGKVHYAGRNSSSHTVSMTFYDDENQTVQNFLNEWYNTLISDPSTGNSADKSQYTADVVIRLKDSKDEQVTAQWKLTKVFPTELGEISLSYDSTDALEIPVTFSYDEKLKV